jgi:hypothetical protein
MYKSLALLPFSLLTMAALPALSQEAPPRVLFCMGQCFGVDDKGTRVPVTKGTELAPGLHLETGPDSYAQVKLGRDSAYGIGERARVRFDRRDRDRDVVILDQGRIRVLGGDVIGRPIARPVELHTVDGNFILRSADLEVKSLPKVGLAPATTLVKLNLGDVRLGDVPVTTDVVHGVAGGKVLDKVIPIGDIALPTPSREPAGPTAAAGKIASPPLVSLPVVNLPALEPRPILTPIAVSPAIVSPEFSRTTLASPTLISTTTVLKTDPTLVYTQPIVPASSLILAQPVTTTTGTTSLNTIAKEIQSSPTTTTTTAPLTTTVTLQQPKTTTTTFTLSPKLTTTIVR